MQRSQEIAMKGKKGAKTNSLIKGKGSVAYRKTDRQIGGPFIARDPWAVSRASETEQKPLIQSS